MNFIESYTLYYAGMGEHRIRALAGSKILGNLIEGTNNKRLAEWALDRLKFDQETANKIQALGGANNGAIAERQEDYLQSLHHRYSAEIRSKWENPPMTDEEIQEEIYNNLFQKQFQNLSKRQEIII